MQADCSHVRTVKWLAKVDIGRDRARKHRWRYVRSLRTPTRSKVSKTSGTRTQTRPFNYSRRGFAPTKVATPSRCPDHFPLSSRLSPFYSDTCNWISVEKSPRAFTTTVSSVFRFDRSYFNSRCESSDSPYRSLAARSFVVERSSIESLRDALGKVLEVSQHGSASGVQERCATSAAHRRSLLVARRSSLVAVFASMLQVAPISCDKRGISLVATRACDKKKRERERELQNACRMYSVSRLFSVFSSVVEKATLQRNVTVSLTI